MVIKKEEIISEFYFVKANLRSVCLKKCLSFKEEIPGYPLDQSSCLHRCDAKVHEYLKLSEDQYQKIQKND